MIESPIDSLPSSTARVQRRFGYSLRDDVLGDTTQTANTSSFEATYLRNVYNAEQQIDRVDRRFTPDAAAIDTITTRWRYDLAGRVVASVAPDLKVDSVQYDAAGKPTSLVSRRYVPGQPLSMQPVTIVYDVLGRDSIRTIPGFTYAARSQGIPTYEFNYGLDSAYLAYAIPPVADTLTYTKDGYLKTANNRWARVTRGYTPRGELKSEALSIAAENGTFGQHLFTTSFAYDTGGRRRKTALPAQLVPAGQDTIRYDYSPWGALEHVIDPTGTDFRYHYNERNEVVQLTFGATGVTEHWTYDADGRVRRDSLLNNATTFPRWAQPALRRSSFLLDGRDLLLNHTNLAWYNENGTSLYTGLGYLKKNGFRENGKIQNNF